LPPQPIVTHCLSDFEMSDCDFAKDCLSAAVWIAGKPAAPHGARSRTGCMLTLLMSCAVRGVSDYLLRHGCIPCSSPPHLLSCVLQLIPPPPPDFPRALPVGSDARAFPPLPGALAAAANAYQSTAPSSHAASPSLAAAAAAVHALAALHASCCSDDSPMRLLQALPHMQPHYVSRFSSINVYCKTLHFICPLLETEGMHAHACVAYVILLNLPFFRHRRAHWWSRLCINVDNSRFPRSLPPCNDGQCDANYNALLSLSLPSSASHVTSHPLPLGDALLLCALVDKMIPEEDAHALVQRAQRLIDGSSATECSKLTISTAIFNLNLPTLTTAPEIVIEGRASNRAAGQKSHFIGFDDSVGVSVEELALQWCVQCVNI
jgi:hypothetical protein